MSALRSRSLLFASALFAMLAVGSPADAAKRPPPPAGVKVLSAGQLPHYCAAGEPESGVYFDERLKQWLSAPNCYGKWGNLVASAPQIANPEAVASVTATPTDGSNSATYAPETKSIAWDYVGATLKSGCGNADLTCAVKLPKATGSWQWIQVHVTMPRTFLVDNPGSNCAGQHLCAGVQTNAWSWIGVRPKFKCDALGRSTVRAAAKKDDSVCKVPRKVTGDARWKGTIDVRLDDLPVTLSGKSSDGDKVSKKTTTADDGSYSFLVPKGKYTVKLPADGEFANGRSSVDVDVTKKDAKKDVLLIPDLPHESSKVLVPGRSVGRVSLGDTRAEVRKKWGYQGYCPSDESYCFYNRGKPFGLAFTDPTEQTGAARVWFTRGRVSQIMLELYFTSPPPGPNGEQNQTVTAVFKSPLMTFMTQDKAIGLGSTLDNVKFGYPLKASCTDQTRIRGDATSDCQYPANGGYTDMNFSSASNGRRMFVYRVSTEPPLIPPNGL